MITIELETLPKDALIGYDSMMIETCMRVENVSKLAVQIWSAVLKELNNRKLVSLISGSFDDVGNALIHRNYQ
jgi:hypothetical protein